MAKPVISLSQAKAHLRVEHELDDELISTYAEAAVDRTLQEIGLAGALSQEHQTTTLLTRFGFQYPMERLVAVQKRDEAGVWQTVPEEGYSVSGSIEDRQVLSFTDVAAALPGECFRVIWEAGFGETAPAWFRVACLFLLGHFYENRSSVIIGQGVAAAEVPMGFVHLCRPHRRWFFA